MISNCNTIIDNYTVPQKNNFKYLRILLDRKRNFTELINAKINQQKKLLYAFYTIKGMNLPTKKMSQ